MRLRLLLITAFAAVLLCGCTEKKDAEITETLTETSASTFNEYILTRGWDGNELLETIFYCSEYHSLPMNIEEYSEFVLSEGILYFPDNSYAEAETDESGRITALKFISSAAPYDFSIYGVGFNSRITDIQNKIGFANSVYGDEETIITFTYEGGGITQLVFEFKEKKLISVYISA